jgi:hypothetical protein
MSMNSQRTARIQALCIFFNNGKILVYEAKDFVKDEAFFRPLGGGINFQERGIDAVKREILEELGEEIHDVKYLGTLENIYTYNGKPGHEIVLVFCGKLSKSLQRKKRVVALEGTKTGYVVWKNVDDFTNKKQILYPDGLCELVRAHFK